MKKCKHCGDEITTKTTGVQCNTCRMGLARYKMTKVDMINMSESQGNKCLLCDKDIVLFNRRKTNSGYIDHCHETNEVRGILCHPCNTILGYIENANLDLDTVKTYLSR